MSKISYQGANVETTSDSFGGWINKTNQVIYDMGTVVVTVAAVNQPNTTNGGQTTGNAHVEGILSSNTMAVHDGLRGGSTSVPKTLDVVSNTHFKDSDEVRFENIDLVHILGQANTTISGDLNVDGSGKEINVSLGSGNTNFLSGEVYSYANVIIDTDHVDITASNTNIQSNTVFTTSYVFVDSTNTVIGSANTQGLLVQADMDVTGFGHFFEQARFDANVNFYGQHVVFHNDLQFGSTAEDRVVFNSRINSDVEPYTTGYNFGSELLPWQEIHGVELHIDGIANVGGIFALYGGSAREAMAKSTNTGYQDFKFLLETSTGHQKNPLTLTSSSAEPGADTSFDLGTSTMRWDGVYARDLFISRDGEIDRNLTVGGQGDFASLNVRDLTPTRIVYTDANGELVDTASMTFNELDQRLVANNVLVTTQLRTQGDVFLGSQSTDIVETSGDLTVNRDLYVAGNTAFASNTELAFATGKIDDLIVYSTAQLRGNTEIGNANTDLLEITAKLGSNITPSSDVSYDLGKGDLRFKDIYAGEFKGNLNWSNVTNKPDPRITLNVTGDVSGSASTTLNNLSDGTISIATTIQPNSVALGTDTTGTYVSEISSGNAGLVVSGNSGETRSITVNHADTSNVSDINNNNSGGTVIQDVALQFDEFGHVTSRTVNSVNLDGRYVQSAFSRIILENDTDIVADSTSDTVRFIEGSGIRLRSGDNSNNDELTITATDTLDSVLARGSSTGRNVTFNGNVTANTMTMKGSLTVDGNLVVNGTTSFVNTETVTIADNILLLNSNETGSPSQDAGFEVERGTAGNVKFVWDESQNRFSTGGQDLYVGKIYGEVSGRADTATFANTAAHADNADNADNASYATRAGRWNNDRRITLGGDLSGSATFDGSSNFTLNAYVANDSHYHDGRYYTKGDTDGRYARNSGDTLNGTYAFNGTVRFNHGEGLEIRDGGENPFGLGGDHRFINIRDNNPSADGSLTFTYDKDNTGDADGWILSLGKNYVKSNNPILVNGNEVWHKGNDGSGSGLHADYLDGQHGSYYRDADNIYTGTLHNNRLNSTLQPKYIQFDNQESTNGNSGCIAYDASEGLLINKGSTDYVILDGENINEGVGINISGGVGSSGGRITFSVSESQIKEWADEEINSNSGTIKNWASNEAEERIRNYGHNHLVDLNRANNMDGGFIRYFAYGKTLYSGNTWNLSTDGSGEGNQYQYLTCAGNITLGHPDHYVGGNKLGHSMYLLVYYRNNGSFTFDGFQRVTGDTMDARSGRYYLIEIHTVEARSVAVVHKL